MSDDLVKRLRDHIAVSFDDRGHVFEDDALCDDAADRIEELEAENADLKAKLAKAVEWFDEIRQHCANFGRGVLTIDERIVERCEDTAANAIEYLAGGKDD